MGQLRFDVELLFHCIHENLSFVKFSNIRANTHNSLWRLAGAFARNFLAFNGLQSISWLNYGFKRRCKPRVPILTTNKSFSSVQPRIVSMRLPRRLRKEPAMNFSTPEVRYKKVRCFSSFDDFMDAIMGSATEKSKEKHLSRKTLHQARQQTFFGKFLR